jgi:phospholipid/cholesterol/gamma-HCH transport system substrate-binding protein
MKKISHEVIVGAIALITIAAFFLLYNFLKGKNLLNPSGTYYVVYREIGGLTRSNPVEINGFRAGVVQSVDFINDKSGRLLVKLSINKSFVLPKNTVAEITAASLIAGMKIRLVFGEGPDVYHNGDTIPGRLDESIIKRVQDQLTPLTDKLTGLIENLDSVLTGINDVLSPEFRLNLKGSMSHLNNTTKNLDEIVGSDDKGLKKMTSDLNVFTKMLADNSQKLGSTIGNLESVSDTLAAADLYATISNLKSTLEKTSEILGKMNNGEGTTGQLLTNDSLYINLNKSVESLDLLLKDVKQNPKRYFSLFGKKNK